MATVAVERSPVEAAEDERDALEAIARLVGDDAAQGLALVGEGERRVELPQSIVALLRQGIRALVGDQAVAVVPVEKLLTTQQAANLLNVSRPYLIRLLDEGEIPHIMTGTHRRVRLHDLLEYRRRWDTYVRDGLDRLAQMSQELGLYSDLEDTAATASSTQPVSGD